MYEKCTVICKGEEFLRISECSVDYIYDGLGRLLMSSRTDYLDVIDHYYFGACIQARNRSTGITSWYSFEGTKLYF